VSADELGPMEQRLRVLRQAHPRLAGGAGARVRGEVLGPKQGKLTTLMGRLPDRGGAGRVSARAHASKSYLLLDEICDFYARAPMCPAAVSIRGSCTSTKLN